MSEIERNRNQTSIDPLASSIEAELGGWLSSAPSAFNPIYKVPINLREVDVKAYEPKILSIGPYHHGKENLQAMEKVKWQCLFHIVMRNRNSTIENYVRVIRVLESRAKCSYSELNDINRMGSDNFVKMLLLDACFLLWFLGAIPVSMEIPSSVETPQSGVIPNNEDVVENVEILQREESQQSSTNRIKNPNEDVVQNVEMQSSTNQNNPNEDVVQNVEILQREESQQNKPNEDEVQNVDILQREESQQSRTNQNNPNEDVVQNMEILQREESQQNNPDEPAWSDGYIMHDILLLENQLPFFILQKIHELAVPNHSQSLTEITAATVSGFLKNYIDIHPDIRSFRANHLLHFCYHFFCSDLGSDMDNQPSQRDIDIHQPVQLHRATELWEAGIKFKRAGNRKLLDIKFSNGTMEIPYLHVEDYTISLFRNLIALEQSCPTLGQHFISYAQFLVNLVSMPIDVKLLSRKKIIENHLGSEKDVSDMISKLALEISLLPGPNYLYPVCMEVKTFAGSKFRRWVAWLKHKYNNPWLFLSLVVAIILLGCAILQTVYTVEGYYNQQH